MVRSLCIAIALAGTIAAQSFEVASIKPHAAKDACPTTNLLPGGRFVAGCWPLRQIVQEAYDVLASQISGGPPWFYTEPWDITAKADGVAGEIPLVQFRSMLRELIQERFHLILREDTKMLPGLVLLVSRKGPKLTPNAGASYQFDLEPGPTLICKKVTMAQFAAWLKGFTGDLKVVEDKTGISGEYDFVLRWSPPQRSSDNGPSIFTALQEQLGLRLKSQKIPTKLLIIQSAGRPDDN